MPERKVSLQGRAEKENASNNSSNIYRTPRRACKDLALARLLAPVDSESSSHEETSSCGRTPDSSECSVSDSTSLSSEYSNPHLACRQRPNKKPPLPAACISGHRSGRGCTRKTGKTIVSRRRSMTTLAHSARKPSKPFTTFLPKRTLSVGPSERRPTFRSSDCSSECLPGREYEFEAIKTFITGKLSEDSGGCMYISGLPGTGKTASVNAVLAQLSSQHSQYASRFLKVAVNGMQVDDPKQVYVQIYQQFTGKLVSVNQAVRYLETEFCAQSIKSLSHAARTRACPVVLVIDELDLLCTRRQDVLYNLFDWPARPRGHRSLIVITIANTMDLPERLLHPRVASRLGLARLTFAPYTHEQLAHIVRSRLAGDLANSFQDKALELAARKVAAVSGDVRRALDVCRRAVEMAGQSTFCSEIGIAHINAAIKEMFTTPKTNAIRACSVYEKLFLQALVAEFQARSTEEARLDRCIRQMCALCRMEALACPTTSEVFDICSSLGAHKLLLTEPSRRDTSMLVRLNCSKSDVLFALKARMEA